MQWIYTILSWATYTKQTHITMISLMKITFLFFTILGFMNQEKLIEVSTQEPIKSTDIKIDVVQLGWQTLKYNIYTKGISNPENIPSDSSNIYVLKISYKDSLHYSQPYFSDNNLLNNRIAMYFDFVLKNNTIYCNMQSPSYKELNQRVVLRDLEVDIKELMQFYEKQIKKEE